MGIGISWNCRYPFFYSTGRIIEVLLFGGDFVMREFADEICPKILLLPPEIYKMITGDEYE